MQSLPTDEDGVSSAISTVLMVAVVLALAVSAGVFYFDLADDVAGTDAPTAVFSWTQNGNSVTVAMEGGESVPADELYVVVGDTRVPWRDVGGSGTIEAGASATLTVTGTTDVRIVWEPSDGKSSTTLATRTIEAPASAVFSGTNAGVKSSNDDGSSLGFANKRLEDAGYTPEGHARIAPYKPSDRLQFRDTADSVIAAQSFAASPGTYDFTLVYDGSEFTLTVDGQTVQTGAFSVEEDAIAIQLKRSGSDVTTAELSNLELDGASIGSPDGMVVTGSDQKSILLEGGEFDDGFTLTGEFTFADDGTGPGDESFVVRIDVA